MTRSSIQKRMKSLTTLKREEKRRRALPLLPNLRSPHPARLAARALVHTLYPTQMLQPMRAQQPQYHRQQSSSVYAPCCHILAHSRMRGSATGGSIVQIRLQMSFRILAMQSPSPIQLYGGSRVRMFLNYCYNNQNDLLVQAQVCGRNSHTLSILAQLV